MGIATAVCARCAESPTRRSFEGLPTCESCERRLREERASEEKLRACPVDGATMRKELVQMVAIDRCPTCGGVWLDGGELELVQAAVRKEGGRGFASGLILRMPPR